MLTDKQCSIINRHLSENISLYHSDDSFIMGGVNVNDTDESHFREGERNG